MAFEEFSYDPITGIRTLFDYDDEKDLAVFRREEDVTAVLKIAAEARAKGVGSYLGQSDEKWFPQAIIPATVMAEMMKKGIDVCGMEGKDAIAVAKEVEQNYSHLKLTDKRIWLPT